jgi:hypothetical protein
MIMQTVPDALSARYQQVQQDRQSGPQRGALAWWQALTSTEVEALHFSFFSLERFDHASVILYQSRTAHGLTASTTSSCTDASPIGMPATGGHMATRS